jgi:formate hydrogenlyase subunit 3/multisubunit Na+/H+ antiporter MnhD subunit
MTLLVLALAVLVLGGLAALAADASPRRASRLGAGSAAIGAALGLVPAFAALAGRDVGALELAWAVPGGAISLALDPLSAFFLVPVLALPAVAAWYGGEYLAAEARHARLGPIWLWFNWLTVSMAIVVTARNALLFLVAWEAMALTSAFLVLFDHGRAEVQRAGWIYLVATHLGTGFLLILFALLARESGSLDFADWHAPAAGASILFLLALAGFGTKAGLVPLHAWLPEAHPAAPSPVSAVMSGVMIKTGVYGLLRTLEFLGPAQASWGGLLLVIGLLSGLGGVLLALAQHDLKRLLAYHSVENVGIIVLALGLGVLAQQRGEHAVAALAFAGALLHVWNHGLFKALLFLAAGSISRATGTVELERLGGLLRRMPWTGAAFLLGAAAICALPPGNGFVSEFLVYSAALRAVSEPGPALAGPLAAIAGLGLIGGLALACFAKAAGIALLGQPRSRESEEAQESGPAMRSAMLVLAGGCLLLGVAAPLGLAAAARPVAEAFDAHPAALAALAAAFPVLWKVGGVASAVVGAALGAAALRRRLLRARRPVIGATWDCGYAAPTARMQYTASSFSQPLTALFAPLLRARREPSPSRALFPEPVSFATHVSDPGERLFAPLFRGVAAVARGVRVLQSGSTHLYVLYVALATLGLLAWGLR